jgi:hypothetical protein
MEMIEVARVEERPVNLNVGIRVITPFRGMLAARDRLLAEARAEINEAGIETVGYGFLRLHVIDMDGPMDLEAGYSRPDQCTPNTRGSSLARWPRDVTRR